MTKLFAVIITEEVVMPVSSAYSQKKTMKSKAAPKKVVAKTVKKKAKKK